MASRARVLLGLGLSVVGVSLLGAGHALAQSNRGGISGTVRDTTGAVVPGATVIITSLGTNRPVEIVTAADGTYTASSLEPVEYRVSVEMTGFKKALVPRVKVDTATTTTVNLTLEAGGVETEVTVSAEVLINRASGTAGQTITERQIQDVPLNNRSVLDLAVTIPNVMGDVGSEDPAVTSGATVPGFNLSLNGGRPGSTAILADGVNNRGVGLARAIVSFSPETVQEFTVQTSAYSAEFGETGGGVINATTKSGTNRFSGTALWYHRDPATNASPFSLATINRPENNLKTDQVSFTIGGPVRLPRYNGRNKTFFFLAIEPRWRQDFVQQTTLLPTDAMRAGDFSGLSRVRLGWAPSDVVARFGVPVTGDSTIYRQFDLVNGQLRQLPMPASGAYAPFPGNRIPTEMIDPTAVRALDAFLSHAGDYFLNSDGDLVNSVVDRFVEENEVRYQLRLDHQLTQANHLTGRYTRVPSVGQRGFDSDVNGNSADYSFSQQFMISDTHVLSSRMLNDLRVNYTRGTFSNDFTPDFSIKGGRNLATELGLPSLTSGGMPLLQFTDGPNAFGNIGSSGSTNNFNVEERYNIADTLYWTRGAMSWKFGVDYSHERLNVVPFFGASGGRWDFRVIQTSNNRSTSTAAGGNSYASYLLGVPNVVLVRPVLLSYYYRWNNLAAFVQNDWKVRPDLTLNLGLRYSLQLPRTEKNNLQGTYLPELSQEFPLQQPVVLGDGRVITTALVPPFGYAGRGGRSKYLFPIEYLDFEPRVAFAWSPGSHEREFVVRGGYGISHLPLTGNNRLPNPDFGATNNVASTNVGSTGTVDPNFAPRLSSNVPLLGSATPEQALNIPQDGLVYLNSINIPGFALSPDMQVPYFQNWNATVSFAVMRDTVLELGYVGSRGTHLFTPRRNINPRDFAFVEALEGANLNPDNGVADPLGRRDLLGSPVSVSRGALASQYLGFNRLNVLYDSTGTSHREGGYVSVIRRLAQGLSFTANYSYGHVTDNASDASPDTNVLTTGRTDGHVTFGAPLSDDQATSTYDIKHVFNATAIWDLPFGNGRRFLDGTHAPLRWIAGDWTVSGVFRLQGGYPFLPKISDSNRLSADQTHTIRPDLVPGVPLVNPRWDRDCPLGNLCEPYVNPAAFMRPAKGQLGSAPRTLDIRGPMQQYFDLSLQKNFPVGGNRRVQLRVDLINAFNHPNFRTVPNDNGTDLMGLPAEAPITSAEYDAWARFNNRPLSTTADGQALMSRVQNLVIDRRLPSGALPLDFFRVQLPEGFATMNVNQFDVTTLDGYKLYRSRQAYNQGFGQLYVPNTNARYIQIGIRFMF
jgi:Carboxypeptidase regulatory-like domain